MPGDLGGHFRKFVNAALKASFLSCRTTESGKWFQSLMVLGTNEFLYMSVLQRISLTHFEFEVRCFRWLNCNMEFGGFVGFMEKFSSQ